MIALNLLHEIRAAGLDLERVGDKLRVTPPGMLTPELRSRIITNKADLFAAIDLEQRVRAMARRWNYAPDDLTYALNGARIDPDKWQRAVALDESREQEFRAAGLLPRADA